ncbi:Asp23/Gls24 family envelope stress response protein [Christensenella intestinihominis]|uniref:Asp23/Gls24 family envelope stress response protein n=1 Tax=Christensenella intestinihominis TaxID=1851429 RepID=UPI00082C5CEF
MKQDITTVKRESYGTVAFASEVIAILAGLAAVDVPGVAGMSGGFVDGLVELLGRKNLSRGIKIELGQEEVAVDASIIVEYGKSIPEIAGMIQSGVKQAIESMTGLKVTEVNVRVQGLKLETQTQDIAEPVLARVK